ncbi:cytochrome c-type biogenesis protein CcmH [Thiomicrorhabdus sp. 6S2-11]|uniref:Cytochrome c-type biogenesis protein n=1 Tax=Thiomicrorhabdus marina TaxID=2818442 RepID=A0ABS3Q3T9_9GAMM|nr:cytochrome c-type biogenesis protein [Thiomicrorhabdus marina]MBO1926999.1 cytochrome c-type biogenesis protein CcmH [Thiomicrorhabdus marina]
MNWLRLLLISVLLSFHSQSFAAIETYQFDSVEQEEAYKELIFELRCLVCQNQNLADSNAELAQDLRQQVYEMLTKQNASKDEIVDYMVARYGEFVMYKPPVEPNTYLLWVGPFLFLLIGLWILIRIIRSNQQNNELDK